MGIIRTGWTKNGNTQNASLTADKELNNLMYDMPCHRIQKSQTFQQGAFLAQPV